MRVRTRRLLTRKGHWKLHQEKPKIPDFLDKHKEPTMEVKKSWREQ